jgi:hypothetical protein
MTYWTPKLVEARLAEAVSAIDQRASRGPSPLPEERAQPDAALAWFLCLEPEDAELLWMRVESRPWKEICRHFHISRSTGNRRVEYLLSVLAWKLNHEHLPSTWSRRYLVERIRAVSSDV